MHSCFLTCRDFKSPKDAGDVSQLADAKPAKQLVSLVVVHAADQPLTEPPSKAVLEMIPMIRDLKDDTSAILPASLHMVETSPHYAFTIVCTSISDGSKIFLPCQKILALVRSSKNSKADRLGDGYKLVTPDVEDLLSIENPTAAITSCSQRLRSYVEVIVLCIGYSAFTVAIPSYCPNLYWPQCIYSGDSILLSQGVHCHQK